MVPRLMVSTWPSQSMHPGQWRKAIGRLRLISINAPAISRPKPRCDFHGRSGRTHGTVGATDRQEPRGEKKVPITYRIEGNKRFAEIPNILHMSVDPLPTAHPSGEIWANTGHPVSPDKLAFATGRRETPLPITGCAGIILARTGITHRSAGQTVCDQSDVRFWG